jgi:signal transduction histidine kinase
MKITTRIVSGYGLLIVVLAGLVIYQISTVNIMRLISKRIQNINFQIAFDSLQMLKDRELVEEYTRKTLLAPEPGNANQLESFMEQFESDLMQIKAITNSGQELNEINRLEQVWKSFTVDLTLAQHRVHQNGALLPQSLQDDLDQMQTRIQAVYDSIMRSMSSQLEKSQKTCQTAEVVLISSASVALLISCLIIALIFRSISKPLTHLTEGTRAIAEGKFFYRLDTSRNDEFAQLAKDFNTMTRRLSELDELKKDFVSNVSHELKAPLASMRETVLILLDQIPGPLTEKQRRFLDLNLQSVNRLTSMIGNLLDLSKTEAGMMEYELKSHDLVPLVRMALAEFEIPAQERLIQIETLLPDKPLPVECDSGRIVQVIVNIVGNAIKFSPKGGIVQVQAEVRSTIPENMPMHWRDLIADVEQSGYFGMLTVTDSGPGVPDSDKEMVFEKFHQVKQGKNISGQGVGLGLAICRTIVQAHHGAIWVEDNFGGGSRFVLLLIGNRRSRPVSLLAS